MKLIIAGVGPGSPNLITLEALNALRDSDLIIVPRSHDNNKGVAEEIILTHLSAVVDPSDPDLSAAKIIRILFPMIRDSVRREEIIYGQLINLESELNHAEKIFFPVIGDSILFSTGAYLIESLKKIFPRLEIEFIPGISAHSVAAACAKKFLALSDEVLAIVPGTADPEKVKAILKSSNAVAIYKPNALKNLRGLVNECGPYEKIFRIDFAGLPDKEKVFHSEKALENINEYLSIILLWKN